MSPTARPGRGLFWWLVAAAVANLVAVGMHWINAIGPERGWLTVLAFTIQIPALVVLVAVIVIARRRRPNQLRTEHPAK